MKRLIPVLMASAFLTACSAVKLELPFGVGGSKQAPVQATSEGNIRIAAAAGASQDKCRSQKSAEQRARQLLVTITTKFSSGAPTEFGSGILISVSGSTAYILTAGHVVQKSKAGKPAIKVAIEGKDGAVLELPGQVATQFSQSAEHYRDIAVIQVPLGTEQFSPEWAVLRTSQDGTGIKNAIVIGNPAGRGKTATPPGDADYKTPHELRVNSGVMEPGYSGGAVFDAERHLAGLVFEDSGQYAAAYPIDPLLKLLASRGLFSSLTPAPASKSGVYLGDVSGRPVELIKSARTVVVSALERAGFEPGCIGSTYKLTLKVDGADTSGTSSTVRIHSTLLGPAGELPIEDEQISFLHMLGQSPLDSASALDGKMRKAADRLVSKLTAKIGGA